MLKLQTLRFANIGRFVGEHRIDAGDIRGLCQVDAKNSNTGGSSGSGKTTAFNALEYALGVNEIPATRLQSRLTKDPLWVSAGFSSEYGDVVIERSKSGTLKLTVAGVVTEGSATIVEQKLQQIIGVPNKLIRKILHKRQGEGGFFLSLSPKETHEFLTEALGLSEWQRKAKKAAEDIAVLTPRVAQLKSEISAYAPVVASLEAKLASLEAPVPPVDPGIIAVLETHLEANNRALKDAKARMAQRIADVESRFPVPEEPRIADTNEEIRSLEAEAQTARALYSDALRRHGDELRAASEACRRAETELSSARAAADALPRLAADLDACKQELEKTKLGQCPTCAQAWGQGSHRHVEELKTKARDLFARIRACEALEARLVGLEAAAEAAKADLRVATSQPSQEACLRTESRLADARSALARQNANTTMAYAAQTKIISEQKRKQIQAVSEEFDAEIQNLSLSIAHYESQISAAKNAMFQYQTSLGYFHREKQSCESDIRQYKDKIRDAEGHLVSAEIQLKTAEAAAREIRSYTNHLFQDALAHIGNRATELLSKIPNMATAAVRLEGFKETKSGPVKEEVSASISVDADIGIPVDTMSGGERAAVDLAVDLAVIDVIEQKTGKGFDVIILDEPFDGLDAVCREQCLQVLEQSCSHKKIFVVDHSEETKQMVASKITVIREGLQSRIA